jgi:hypothetical protein
LLILVFMRSTIVRQHDGDVVGGTVTPRATGTKSRSA